MCEISSTTTCDPLRKIQWGGFSKSRSTQSDKECKGIWSLINVTVRIQIGKLLLVASNMQRCGRRALESRLEWWPCFFWRNLLEFCAFSSTIYSFILAKINAFYWMYAVFTFSIMAMLCYHLCTQSSLWVANPIASEGHTRFHVVWIHRVILNVTGC